MNNIIYLKWGGLKGYNFDSKFMEKNKDIVEEFINIWNEIYENTCSATGGADKLQSNIDLKNRSIDILEKLYNLGVAIYNDWDDTYYNSFEDVKNYIINYGE